MITRFRQYLNMLDYKLKCMFDSQTSYIKCKKGCAYCCREGEYPMSELEFINIMFCYNKLDENIKEKINENIQNLLKKKREKLYECPFLINGECAVYEARAIICRTFGLISYNDKGKKRIPFCVDLGLNYADVYNPNTSEIIEPPEGKTEQPLAFNIDRSLLRSIKAEKEYQIFFGEDKPLVEWLSEDFSNN